MSLQPALDQINAQAARLGRDPVAGQFEWWEEPDGCGVTMTCTWPDGVELRGYAPEGMASIHASQQPSSATFH